MYCVTFITVKALLSPGGAYLFFAVLEGGVLERGLIINTRKKFIKLFLCTLMAGSIKQKLC